MKNLQSEKSVTQIQILRVDSTLISNNFVPNQLGKFRRNAYQLEDTGKKGIEKSVLYSATKTQSSSRLQDKVK